MTLIKAARLDFIKVSVELDMASPALSSTPPHLQLFATEDRAKFIVIVLVILAEANLRITLLAYSVARMLDPAEQVTKLVVSLDGPWYPCD